MKISFHGIKNSAAIYTEIGNKRMTKNGLQPECKCNTLHITATNNNGRDLDYIEPVLKILPNRINQNSLNISLDEYYQEAAIHPYRVYTINEDTLNLNKATLPIFEKICKFLERISNIPAKNVIIDKNYSNSKEALYAFRRHYDSDNDSELKNILNAAFSDGESACSSAQYFARSIKQDIEKFKLEQKQLDDYSKQFV